MSISFLGALAGTLAALAGAGLLIRLCARAFRMDLVAFVVALGGLAIALAAQALGYHRGFGPTTFRAAQLGAALIAPLALCWGMVELTAKSLVARFAARLCLGGLFVVAAVILATDVLSSQPFSRAWPAARMHFEFLPLGLLAVVAVVVVGTAAGTLATVGVRAGRDPRWRPALPAAAAAAAGAVATQGLLVHLPVNSADVVLCLVAVAGAWLAGDRAARVPLAALRHGRDGGGRDGARPGREAAPGWAANGAGRAGYAGDDSLDLYRDGYRSYDDSGGYVATGGYGDTGSFMAPGGYGETGGYPAQPGGGYDGYPDTGGFASYPGAGYPGSRGDAGRPAAGAGDRRVRCALPGQRARPPGRGGGGGRGARPARPRGRTGWRTRSSSPPGCSWPRWRRPCWPRRPGTGRPAAARPGRAAQPGRAGRMPRAAGVRGAGRVTSTSTSTPTGSTARSPSTRCSRRGRPNSTGCPARCWPRSGPVSRTPWCTWCTRSRPRRCSASSTRCTGTGMPTTSTSGSRT